MEVTMSDPNHTPEPEKPSVPSAHPTPPPVTPDPTLAYELPAAPAPYQAPGPGAWGTSAPPPPLQPMAGSAPSLVSPPERNWAVATHLSGFLTVGLGLGFVGPLVVLLTGGNRSHYVRRHAVDALNFNLTWLIAAVVSALLVLVLIGILLLFVLVILYLVLVATIAGAVAASRGEEYRYPLAIRFIS
jgi:uncharacterized Tic20 family protein